MKMQPLILTTLLCTLCVACGSSSSSDEEKKTTEGYNSEYCEAIADSLDIHWEWINTETPCTGIEMTDGTEEDASDGEINISGTSVTNESCIGTGIYNFTLSEDKLTLTGTDTLNEIEMTLTRYAHEDCFVGIWDDGEYEYQAHISADFFLED